MIISRTPFRISFFGGGTDYPAWYREHGGAVLADLDRQVLLPHLPLPAAVLRAPHPRRLLEDRERASRSTRSSTPRCARCCASSTSSAGSRSTTTATCRRAAGLGSSSAFTVGLLHALHGAEGPGCRASSSWRSEAIHIEQDVLGETRRLAGPGGRGATAASTASSSCPSGELRGARRSRSPASALAELQTHLLLFFTGVSAHRRRTSRESYDRQPRQRADASCATCSDDGRRGDRASCTAAADRSTVRRPAARGLAAQAARCSDEVSTTEIDEIYERARDAGALGGKLLGAGGGGFLLLFARPEDQPRIRAELAHLIHAPVNFDESGSRVVLYQPNGLN